MIAIIDYGAGNLHSVKNALDYIGHKSIITADKKTILSCDKIILPGVGSFGDAMDSMRTSGLEDTVKECMYSDRPFLGICLGLQLLFEDSMESEGKIGIGYFQGGSKRIPDTGLKIPHIGWNSLEYNKNSKLFYNIGDQPYVYFVHSYYIESKDEDIISAYTEYGARLPVAVERDNVYAVQFHPEKSGRVGMKILTNFVKEVL